MSDDKEKEKVCVQTLPKEQIKLEYTSLKEADLNVAGESAVLTNTNANMEFVQESGVVQTVKKEVFEPVKEDCEPLQDIKVEEITMDCPVVKEPDLVKLQTMEGKLLLDVQVTNLFNQHR